MAKLLSHHRQTLDGWIAEAIADQDKDGTCRMISLMHTTPGAVEREVHTVVLSRNDRGAVALAHLFNAKAGSYAQDLPGTQTFSLNAFYGESQEPQAFHPIRIASESANMPGMSSDAPTPEALISAAIRYGNTSQELLLAQTATLFKATMETLAMLQEQNSKLMAENQDAYVMVKEMAVEKINNQHDLRMKEMQFERSTAMQQELLKKLPMIVNTVTGKPIFPQETVDTQLIEMLAEKVTPEMISQLVAAGMLDDQAAGMLTHRLHAVLEKKRAEEHEVKQLAAMARVTSQNPEAEAAGDVETVQ